MNNLSSINEGNISLNVSLEVQKKTIVLREKADKKIKLAANFQEIVDQPDFQTDPNSYVDNLNYGLQASTPCV